MTATILAFPKQRARRPEYSEWQHRTDAAILELGEQMDNLRHLIDTPHATDDPVEKLDPRGVSHVFTVLACWCAFNTILLVGLLLGG